MSTPPLNNAGNTQTAEKTVRQIKDGTLNSLYIGEDNIPLFIFLDEVKWLLLRFHQAGESSSRVHIYYFMNLQQRICFKGNTTTRIHDN